MPQAIERTNRMFLEASESGDAVARMLSANAHAFATLGQRLRAGAPRLIVTCARGSSAHAATYGRYLFETLLGIPVLSAAPSVASIFGAPAGIAADELCIAISQSGRSPDLLASVESRRAAGAHVVALVNDETSPLAQCADTLIALKAGPERSIAATKSCLSAMAALVAIVSEAGTDATLRAEARLLPERLSDAFEQRWTAMIEALPTASSLFVIGRGYGLGIALEMALKLKETCALHAEAFSAAEVRHGPMAIVGRGFPVLALAGSDAAGASVREMAAEFAARGATVLLADPLNPAALFMAPAHPAIEPLLALASFYRAANSLALTRGLDPDAPPHLTKVTRTT